jgi:Trypsin-like peptidase domain
VPYSQRDIAALRADHTIQLVPAKLSELPPQVGQPIYLIAKTTSKGQMGIFEAVIVERTERTLIFRFRSSDYLPDQTSGAPLLDRDGYVVGINVGAGRIEGYNFGHGNHVTSIRRHLNLPCSLGSGVI